MEQVYLILEWLVTIVGTASVIVAALSKVAALTPSKKDDELLKGASKFLAKVVDVLDLIALNPNKSGARK